MRMTISFDLDGTLASLYSVNGWLEDLRAERTRPYAEAKPMVNMSALARQINRLQKKGYYFEIISWTAKNGTAEYNNRVAEVKREWLAKHMPSVKWDKINIVPYGVAKTTVGSYGILFDDEEQNRRDWNEYSYKAYDVDRIMEVLREM